MKKVVLVLSLVLLIKTWGCGVAYIAMPDARNWKETTYRSNMDLKNTYSIATQTVGEIGKVNFAQENTNQISGECQKVYVEVLVSLMEKEGKVLVTVKSRFKDRGDKALEVAGERSDCIETIVNKMKELGCKLTEIKTTKK